MRGDSEETSLLALIVGVLGGSKLKWLLLVVWGPGLGEGVQPGRWCRSPLVEMELWRLSSLQELHLLDPHLPVVHFVRGAPNEPLRGPMVGPSKSDLLERCCCWSCLGELLPLSQSDSAPGTVSPSGTLN